MDAKVACQMNLIIFFKSLPHSTEMTMGRWRLEQDRLVLASTRVLLVIIYRGFSCSGRGSSWGGGGAGRGNRVRMV